MFKRAQEEVVNDLFSPPFFIWFYYSLQKYGGREDSLCHQPFAANTILYTLVYILSYNTSEKDEFTHFSSDCKSKICGFPAVQAVDDPSKAPPSGPSSPVRSSGTTRASTSLQPSPGPPARRPATQRVAWSTESPACSTLLHLQQRPHPPPPLPPPPPPPGLCLEAALRLCGRSCSWWPWWPHSCSWSTRPWRATVPAPLRRRPLQSRGKRKRCQRKKERKKKSAFFFSILLFELKW